MIQNKSLSDELNESEKKYYKSQLMIPFASFDGDEHVNVQKTACIFHPRHMHDCIEILYVLKGHLQLWQSFDTRILSAGEFVCINHFDLHHYESLGEEAIIISIHISPELYQSAEGMLLIKPTGIKEEPELYHRTVSAILALADAYETQKNSTDVEKALNHLLMILRNELKWESFDHEGQRVYFNSHDNYNLDRKNVIYTYLYARYPDKISLDDLSKVVGLSRHHLSRYIRKYFGYTYNDLLKSIRCDRAEILLLEGEQTLTEIAAACGFSSERMFKAYFCEIFRTTPREYRESLKNKTILNRDFEDASSINSDYVVQHESRNDQPRVGTTVKMTLPSGNYVIKVIDSCNDNRMRTICVEDEGDCNLEIYENDCLIMIKKQ